MYQAIKHILILSLLYCNGHAWRTVKVIFTNLDYNYNNEFGEANATLSTHGSVSFFVKSSKNIDRLFLNSLVQFSSDGTDNFDINFTNKTVYICKLTRNLRYEPLIQLVYKILSDKVHLPRCPVKKNDIFYTKDFQFTSDLT